jgi:hypothetical protein
MSQTNLKLIHRLRFFVVNERKLVVNPVDHLHNAAVSYIYIYRYLGQDISITLKMFKKVPALQREHSFICHLDKGCTKLLDLSYLRGRFRG